uniref:Uncharacterized protein n=1 Tax=Glossina pallidipes TaxID=7398 RepID=A0A1B0A446_GLOPL
MKHIQMQQPINKIFKTSRKTSNVPQLRSVQEACREHMPLNKKYADTVIYLKDNWWPPVDAEDLIIKGPTTLKLRDTPKVPDSPTTHSGQIPHFRHYHVDLI